MAASTHNLDYFTLLRAAKRLQPDGTSQKIRVALLSDAATQQLVPLLRVLFHDSGVDVAIYEGPFDGIQLETVDAGSALYRFEPDIIIILNSIQALRAAFGKRRASGTEFLEEKSRELVAVWDAIHAHSRATVFQSTYVMPVERCWGNLDRGIADSLLHCATSLNELLVSQAQSRAGVLINDVESLASWVGLRTWFDDRLWDLAKSFCSLDHLPLVAKNIVDMAMAAHGRAVKCVVLDLDNTLWGGVIGDDGLEGIRLDPHGDGEAFYRLQLFLKELTRRGILLAVASKNERAAALLPFEKHPEMVLKLEDMAAFVANWNDKASSIQQIREELNIGLDSMVFLDDNSFERNLVRSVLPQVIVPELPADPADYVRAICELNLFETIAYSAEDSQRTELYRAESARREAQAAFAGADEFLQSLDMRMVAQRFDRYHLPRIAQLTQRSNQFNLTTHRYTEAQCEAMMNDAAILPLYAKLSDRLGDHGLIGVVVLQPSGDELVIRDWLMSCRVLARGVEQYLMNLVFEEAASLHLARVRGEFIRTAKNDMVSHFFAQFGFASEGGHDYTRWMLPVNAYQPCRTFIVPAGQPAAAV